MQQKPGSIHQNEQLNKKQLVFANSWLANHESALAECCLSVVCRRLSSVTFVNCGQTVQDRPMVTMKHYW